MVKDHSDRERENTLLPSLVTLSNWNWETGNWETVLTCLYPSTVQTHLSRDQRPTKPVNRLVTGRGVGGISSMSYFICIIPHRIAHTTAFVTQVVEHLLEQKNSSIGPP